MNFLKIASCSPNTPYAPIWDVKIGTSLCEDLDLDYISKFLLDKEKQIKKLPSSTALDGTFTDGYTGLGKNSTTSKFQYYNILTWKNSEIEKIRQNIIKNVKKYNSECGNQTPDELWIQCWYNVLRFGQKINPHTHSTTSNSYLSGHINISVKNTYTCYMSPINQICSPETIDIKNENGVMTLFPSHIFHYTTSHYSFNPRITIAFDLNYKKFNSNWIRL